MKCLLKKTKQLKPEMTESQIAKPLWMLSHVHGDVPKSLCPEAGRSVGLGSMEGHASAGLDGVRRTASGHGVQTDDALAARLPPQSKEAKGWSPSVGGHSQEA